MQMARQPYISRAVFTVLGAAGWWLAARFGWPYFGPRILNPCPMLTPAGCIVVLIIGGIWGATKALELELAERRRLRINPLPPNIRIHKD